MSMATTKVTFTLDRATIARIQQAASSLALPKSQVVREAIAEFSERIGRLSERERLICFAPSTKWFREFPDVTLGRSIES